MGRAAARHSHSTQHVTDVHTRRVVAGAGDGYVVIGWDYPGSTPLEVRILRSTGGFATSAEDGGPGTSAASGAAPDPAAPSSGEAGIASGQTLVYDDVTGSFRDDGLRNGAAYFYTVFARHPGDKWVRWGEYELRPGEPAAPGLGDRAGAPFRADAPSRSPRASWRAAVATALRRVLPVALVALCAGALLAAPQGAHAASSAPVSRADESYVAVAVADPVVAAVLDGTTYKASVTTWGGTQGTPAGVTVTFTWPAAQARDVAGLWPLLTTEQNGTPVPPYETVVHRVRIDDLTSLQVDVLLSPARVLQLLPLNGETQYKLREETWPPFSWIPWFTSHAWVVLPLYAVLLIVLVARAWQRSRAWNRRLPSMTRHDRQFIGRFVTIAFLLAALGWLIYEAVYAASMPTVDPNGFNPGDLAALPLLLFPPALFLAGLALEVSPAPHRAAWGLVAVLAGAGSLYDLAAAVTGTATNLNLSYYLLLGILCLLAAPRAFSKGRTGWSRSYAARYG